MKQKFKRLFIVFGVFLVFTLLLTIRTPTHAYTSTDMPEGYRLLTANDVGKTFGVDLESIVYFADDVSPYFPQLSTSNPTYIYTNFLEARYVYSDGYGSYVPYIYCNNRNVWIPNNFTTYDENVNGVQITSYNTNYEWNDWFYVKDISNTCYTEEDLENARTEGYNEGYTAGVNSVNTQDYYNAGYTAGSTDGYNEGYDVGYQAGIDSIDTQDYYNQGYTAASDDFLVFENLIFGTMNGFTRTIQSLFDFQIFGISVFGLVGGLVGIAFGIGLIILIIKVVKIFT